MKHNHNPSQWHHNKKLAHRIKSAILEQCSKEGISEPEDISIIVVEALKTVGPMSVAGTRAAQTKHQVLSHQSHQW